MRALNAGAQTYAQQNAAVGASSNLAFDPNNKVGGYQRRRTTTLGGFDAS